MVGFFAKVLSLFALIIISTQVSEAETVSDGSAEGITIMGTIAQSTTENSVALIKLQDNNRVVAVKQGYRILDTYEVVGVMEKYMIIKELKTAQEILIYQERFSHEFRRPTPPAAPTLAARSLATDSYYSEEGFERRDNEIVMSASFRDNIIQNELPKILMQATAEPVMENGRIMGFRIYQIDDGSIFQKGGLRDDDIVTEINGHKLTDIGAAIRLLNSLRDATTVDVTIVRDGNESELHLSVQ